MKALLGTGVFNSDGRSSPEISVLQLTVLIPMLIGEMWKYEFGIWDVWGCAYRRFVADSIAS